MSDQESLRGQGAEVVPLRPRAEAPRRERASDENLDAIRAKMQDDAREPGDLQRDLAKLLRTRIAAHDERDRRRRAAAAPSLLEKAVAQLGNGDRQTTEAALQLVEQAGRDLGLPEPRRRFGLGDALADRPPPPSVCRKLEWEVGRCPMLVGAPGAGKTIIIQAAILDMVVGRPLWGCPDFLVPRPARAAIIDLDQGTDKTLRRFKRLLRGRGVSAVTAGEARAQLADIHRLAPADLGDFEVDAGDGLRLGSLDAVELARWRRDWCAAVRGFDFVAVDSLRRLAPFLDENDSRVSVVPDGLRMVSEETGCVILLLHHASNKQRFERGRPVQQPAGTRGSSAIDGAAGTQLVIEDEDGARRVTQTRPMEAAKLQAFFLAFEDDPAGPDGVRGIRVVYKTLEQVHPPKAKASGDERLEKLGTLLEGVLQKAGPEGRTTRGLRFDVRQTGWKGRNEEIDEAADRLVKAGRCVRRAQGREVRFWGENLGPEDAGP